MCWLLKVELTFLRNFFSCGADYIMRFYTYAGEVVLSDIRNYTDYYTYTAGHH